MGTVKNKRSAFYWFLWIKCNATVILQFIYKHIKGYLFIYEICSNLFLCTFNTLLNIVSKHKIGWDVCKSCLQEWTSIFFFRERCIPGIRRKKTDLIRQWGNCQEGGWLLPKINAITKMIAGAAKIEIFLFLSTICWWLKW